jgi:hypothetical protein
VTIDYPTKVYEQKINEIITDDLLEHPFIADPQQSISLKKIKKTLK